MNNYFAILLVILVTVPLTAKSYAQNSPTRGNLPRQVQTESRTAYTEVDFINPETRQPLKLSIWYPAGSQCDGARICLSDSARLDQAVILSHGAMGSARELNWIGYATASQGFVTIGVNHYGESWAYGQENINPQVASKIWLRASEVSVAIDLLTSNKVGNANTIPLFDKRINWQQLIAIGFSSGGSTVIALAGGRYAPEMAKDYCNSGRSVNDLGCRYTELAATQTISLDNAKADYHDKRIAKIIALDPAAGPMTTKESLQAISVPVLIIGARNSEFLPFDNHSGYYANTIPHAALYTLNDQSGHFVFIDDCDHNFNAMGISLCQDKTGIDRDAVHKQLYPHMFRFIYAGI